MLETSLRASRHPNNQNDIINIQMLIYCNTIEVIKIILLLNID